ncbi:UNVERIFIED_CONTAM: hypothetical protein FKN15_018778 [Acipenser sinensis]
MHLYRARSNTLVLCTEVLCTKVYRAQGHQTLKKASKSFLSKYRYYAPPKKVTPKSANRPADVPQLQFKRYQSSRSLHDDQEYEESLWGFRSYRSAPPKRELIARFGRSDQVIWFWEQLASRRQAAGKKLVLAGSIASLARHTYPAFPVGAGEVLATEAFILDLCTADLRCYIHLANLSTLEAALQAAEQLEAVLSERRGVQ